MSFKIVVLECPYYTFRSDSFAQLLYGKLMGMRIGGYCQKYPDGVFPYGNEDIISDHLIICRESGSEIIPVSSLKMVTFDICKKFKLEFPMLSWINYEKNSSEVLKKSEAFINSCTRKGLNLSYTGSYTRNADIDLTRRELLLVRDLLTTGFVGLFEQKKINYNICAGLPDGLSFIEKLGHKPLLKETIKLKGMCDTKAKIEELSTPSKWAQTVFLNNRNLWDERIQIVAKTQRHIDNSQSHQQKSI